MVIIWDGTRPDALLRANTQIWMPIMELGILIISAYSPFAQNLHDANTVSGPIIHYYDGASGSQHSVTSNGDVWEGDFETYHTTYKVGDGRRTLIRRVSSWTTDALIQWCRLHFGQ